MADDSTTFAPATVTAPPDEAAVYEFEASFAQQRLWFLDQLAPGSPFYHLPVALRLRGRLDTALLRACLDTIVQRHESLRTTFSEGADGVQQLVHEPGHEQGNLAWAQRTVQADAGSLERVAHEQALAEGRQPFDLVRGPLLRACLLTLGNDGWLLCLTMHHIVSDGWSLGVLVGELGALYRAGCVGAPLTLPELPLQYPDYSHWQSEWMSGQARDRQLAFWHEVLEAAPARLELPTDFPRPQRQSFRGELLPLAFDATLTGGLRQLATRTGTSLFMVSLAAYQVFLWRHAGQRDLCVGVPVAGRTRVELEGLIGCFINTVVMRARIDPEASFHELLVQVKVMALGALANQDVPFEQLVEHLQPDRNLSHAPLFQAMFMLQNVPMGEIVLPGVDCRVAELDIGTSKFDLTLSLTERGERLEGYLEYAADLFRRSTVERMGLRLRTVLDAIVANPSKPLAALAWLPADERLQLLRWRADAWTAPVTGLLPSLLDTRFAAMPQDVAIEDGTPAGTLCYGELAARSAALAQRLRAAGVGPDARVAVCLERSSDLVVALVAVLRAGGAYVPLDPAYPPQRLAYVLQEAAPTVLLATAATLARLPGPTPPVLDVGAVEPSADVQTLPPAAVNAGNLAYVLYTSGSTGRPKGVAVTHGALANFLSAMADVPGCERGAGVLALTSVSFDISGLELFLPLVCGGRIVMASRQDALEPARIAARIDAGRARLLQATPSTWRMLLDAGWTPAAHAHCLCGGEALPRDVATRLVQGGARLWNVYGPTETTIWSTLRRVQADLVDGVEGVDAHASIGRPLPQTRLYVLDDRLELVPVGIWGELYIAGAGLARGYLNRPELTAERFVPEAHGPADGPAGQRMYRTGDVVRWLADGQIEFGGRRDDQVKVRGYRIELGEVEAVLGALAQVREAAVVVRDDLPGGRQLVGYAALHAGAHEGAHNGVQATEETLRALLLEKLPEYMVPARCVVVQALPLTPNGKVDRRALPAPGQVRADDRTAPRTPHEQRLAALWAQVLGIDEVGVDDDFFALGGHSLLATRLMSQVRAAFDVELPLRTLFEAPTVQALARCIERSEQQQQAQRLPRIEPLPRVHGQALDLSYAQQRLWFLAQLDPQGAAYNMPMALELRGELDEAALQQTLQQVVARHEVLRTRFETRGGEPVQVVDEPGPVALQRQDVADEAEVDARAAAQAARPFDLATGPLLRATLLALAPQRHVLLLTLHHIVADGWSMGVLVREVGQLYAAQRQGRPAQLPPLPVQYADYAHWQRRVLGDQLQQQLIYWREQLHDAPTLTTLPSDRPRPAVRDEGGAVLSRVLGAGLRRGLERRAQQAQATLFMVLTAAFNALLARWTGQHDLCVGTPIANRQRQETEALVGFFVNTLVLRTRVSGHDSFGQLLQHVRETLLQAYANQDLPFEQLVDAVQPQRHRSHTPLFQVMVVLQNAPMHTLTLPGLELQARPAQTRTAKFDMTLFLHEAEDGTLQTDYEYATALYDRPTIERLAGHFQRLLEQLAGDGVPVVGELELLSAAELQQLRQWNDTGSAAQPGQTVHGLVAEQAQRTPQAVALRWQEQAGQEQAWTYAELETRANRLAHELRSRGCGPGTRVGVCLPRTGELVVALLAVLRSGAAYVPLDPAYPAERIAWMAQDAQLALVLSNAHWSQLAPAGCAGLACAVDDAAYAMHPAHAPPNLAGSCGDRNLAYVIYTSGSTGRPKGVAIEHRSAVAMLHWAHQRFGAPALGGMLASTSVCFDLSVFELFAPLSTGGTVVLVDNALELARLAPSLQQALSFINTVPSAMTELLRQGTLPPAVQVVALAGEPLPDTLVRRIFERSQAQAVYNLYGPSEDTTYSTWDVVQRQAPREVCIGLPLQGTQAHVLDGRGRQLPVGVAGELYLGGEGLARGYLGRPDLTGERFVPDPFGQPGSRLYRTGDRVRWRADGRLEFLGRADHQIKLRGYRIELGEIEAVLRQRPGVQEALAMVRDDTAAGPRLLAWVVPQEGPAEGQALDAASLRQQLQRSLPGYMVPAAIVVLAAFPLTPNGKIDRAALPGPQGNPAAAQSLPQAMDATQQRIAAIWQDLLGVPRVGLHDNFFDLGGHSLLAVRVVAALQTAFGRTASAALVFEHPTVAALAAHVAAAAEPTHDDWPAVVAATDEDSPLSVAQQGVWFMHQFDSARAGYLLPAAIRIDGPLLDAEHLHGALQDLAWRQHSLRTVFLLRNGEPVQRVLPAIDVTLPLLDVQAADDAALHACAREALAGLLASPFDLGQAPLWRCALLRAGADRHVLLLVQHHIVSDGWSSHILLRELIELYAARREHRASTLAPLTAQYVDFARWDRSRQQGDALREPLAYWRGQLADLPPPFELAGSRPASAERSQRGAVVHFEVASTTCADIAAAARSLQATPYMLALTAFALVLGHFGRSADVVVGSPAVNRPRADLQNVIGFFVDALVLRMRLDAAQSLAELVARTRRVALDAQRHRALPFERLVDELRVERGLGTTPLFQVWFNYQNDLDVQMGSAGLSLQPLQLDGAVAKFDLSLTLTEHAGGLRGDLTYAADRIDAAQARRVVDRLGDLLAEAPALLHAPIATLQAALDRRAQARDQDAAARRGRDDRAFLRGLRAGRTVQAQHAVPALPGDRHD